MNKTVLAALVGVLAGGGAIAAYQGISFGTYAEVVSSTPVTVKEPVFGEVVAVEAVTETVTGEREVCEDRVVEKRRPERFGDKDGLVAGAIVGGLLGNQVGGGSGRKVATVAGAVGGAYAGREIDRRHQGGQRYTDTERVCRMVSEAQEKTVGYDVAYRLDGQQGTLRVDQKPEGPQLQVGERDRIVGYDVAWRHEDQTGTLRMDEPPGERLPMEDGAIVVAGHEDADRG